MSENYLPDQAEQVEIKGSTVPFYRYQDNQTTYYQFDTSTAPPPEPFVNAMCGLKLVKDYQTKLNMLNHKAPEGLIDKVSNNFKIEVKELEQDLYRVTFSFKGEASLQADLTAKTCHA
jgi:hypothetical protein